MTTSRLVALAAPLALACLPSLAPAMLSQDSDTSFAGPPPTQDDPNADPNKVPFGIGFNQKGGELSATALEQAALGTPTIHYHYFSSPSPSAPPPGFTEAKYVTPMANQTRNASWHLYAGRGQTPATPGLATNVGADNSNTTTNYHIQQSQLQTGGQSVGEWAPMAEGGMGTVSGFNWGEPYGFD